MGKYIKTGNQLFTLDGRDIILQNTGEGPTIILSNPAEFEDVYLYCSDSISIECKNNVISKVFIELIDWIDSTSNVFDFEEIVRLTINLEKKDNSTQSIQSQDVDNLLQKMTYRHLEWNNDGIN